MPASMEKINELLAVQQLDAAEKWVIKWQFGLLGEFETALAAAITKADMPNLARLSMGFPVQVSGYSRWAFSPELGTKLRAMGLDI